MMAGRNLFAEQPPAGGGRNLFAEPAAKARAEQAEAEQAQAGAGRAQLVAETPSLAGRVSEAFTGAQRQTPETEALPEFRETEEIQGFGPRGLGTQLKLTAGLLTSFSPEARMDVIKESIPEAEFSKDAKGNDIVTINGERSILNKPGMSGQDVVRTLTGILSFAGPTRVAGMAQSALNKILLGGSGAFITEGLIQDVSELAGSKQPREFGRQVAAGVTGAATEAIGPTREALRTRRAARAVGAVPGEAAPAFESIAAAEAAEAATGIPLFPAQRSAVPAQLEKQAFIAQLPAGTRKSFAALRSQNQAASEAVENFMQTIAPPEAVVTGAERFRTAAQKAVQAQKDIRKERTSQLFEGAFQDRSPVDVSSVRELIKTKKVDFPEAGEVSKTLNRISGLIAEEPNLRQLQNAKLEIDQMISKIGEGSLGNTTKREAVEVKNALLDVMDGVSPEFRTARQAFAAESPAITQIEESIIGKAAAFKDVNLKSLSRTIFDPAETNPQVVANAKRVIETSDPEAWNQLLRVELERRIGDMSTDIAEGGVGAIENVPAFLERSLFGNPKQRAILFNSVDEETGANLKFLQTALRRAKLGRPGGSPTAIREEIKRELRGGIPQTLRNFFKAPLTSVAEAGEDVAFNRRVRAMAEMMFDPDNQPRMAEIRRLGPNTAAAGKAMAQLLKEIDSQIITGGENE